MTDEQNAKYHRFMVQKSHRKVYGERPDGGEGRGARREGREDIDRFTAHTTILLSRHLTV